MKRFLNRREAGLELAEKLDRFTGRQHVVVLRSAHGAVPVAYEVGRSLDLPLDVFVVRKLDAPIDPLGITQNTVDRVTMRNQQELNRREKRHGGDRGAVIIKGRIVIAVDDEGAT